MKAYISLPNDFDCSQLCGTVNFLKINQPILNKTIDDVLTQAGGFDPKTQFIACIKFIDDNEIMNAMMSAYMGNSWTRFKIELLDTIVIKQNEGVLANV